MTLEPSPVKQRPNSLSWRPDRRCQGRSRTHVNIAVTRLFERGAQSGGGEVRAMARQIKWKPALGERAALPRVPVGDDYRELAARPQRGVNTAQVSLRIEDVLERVAENRGVNRLPLERHGRERPDEHFRASPARGGRRRGQRLNPDRLPTGADPRRNKITPPAADVEQPSRPRPLRSASNGKRRSRAR